MIRSSSPSRPLLIGVLGLVLLVAGCGQATPAAGLPGQPPAAAAAPVVVQITQVQRGTLSNTLAYSGNVQARQQVSLVSKATARVVKLRVDVGDAVQAGDVLVELETDALAAQVAQTEAGLAAARAKLGALEAGPRAEQVAQAEANLKAARARLAAMEAGPRPEQVAVAAANLDAARQRLAQLEKGGREELVAQAEANLDAARAKLDQVKKGGTPQEVEQARLAVDQAKNALWAAQTSRDGVCGNARNPQYQHPLTHSVGGAVLLSAALAAVVCLATPLKRPWLVFGIGFGGMLLHLLGDLLTPWPIPLFFPLSTRTYSLDLINFLDPFLLVLLGASCFAASRWLDRATLVATLTLLIVAGYLGFRAYGRQTAEYLVRERSPVSRVAALPHGLSPVTWDVIAQEGKSYTHYVVDSLRGAVRSSQIIRSVSDERAIVASANSLLVQTFLRRARFPVTLVTEEGSRTIVEWQDVHLLTSGGMLKGVKVVLDEQGQVIEEGLELGGRR